MSGEDRLQNTPPYRYTVTAFIHQDRRGVLLAGQDRVSGQLVALRQINLRQFDMRYRDAYLATLRRDIATAAAFHHPAIVQPHSLHIEGDDAFIVMDPLEHAVAVETQGPASPERAVDLICQALDALTHAHERRVLLHELRLRNFFATPDGILRIIEFGLVPGDVGDALNTPNARAEEAAIMSPEHCIGEPVGPRSDVFSLGCVLYRLLTGRLPFAGSDYTTTVTQIVSKAHLPLLTVRPGLPQPLGAIVDCALAKKPEDRFDSANAFADALRHAMKPAPKNTDNPAATSDDLAAIGHALEDVIGSLAPVLLRRLTKDHPSRNLLIARILEICPEDSDIFHTALTARQRS